MSAVVTDDRAMRTLSISLNAICWIWQCYPHGLRRSSPLLSLAVPLLLLLLEPAAAAPAITYRSHYPIDSERPNTCEEVFRSQPLNATYNPGQYIPFIGRHFEALPG